VKDETGPARDGRRHELYDIKSPLSRLMPTAAWSAIVGETKAKR